jgi:DNA-binding response OmpR family regulator
MTIPPNETTIVVVEDEKHLAQGLRFNLELEGYRTLVFDDGESAIATLLAPPTPIAAVILDVMLPGRDGFSVVSEMREHENFTPVLLLTARSRPEDVLSGFAAGADDYLAKPFDLSILLARLNGLLRRTSWQRNAVATAKVEVEPASVFTFAGRTIDFAALRLTTAGAPNQDHADDQSRAISLTVMEAELLRYLVRHRGEIISRKQLLEDVWHVREDTDTRAIDNFMVRLRRYIEDDPSSPVYLETVRGIGYRFLPGLPTTIEAAETNKP